MDLLEYQAKELFREMGIPVLPSQRIEHPKDLKGLKIPYPVVLKSQVYRGGRGKAGGIKFVGNTIDAVAVAQSIFHLPIMGEYPKVLLAEAKYDPEREFYLAIVLDRSSRRPLLLGSQDGGTEIETTQKQPQHVIVDQEFSPFYARRLAVQMGLDGLLIQSVSAVVEKMYQLFVLKDLDLIEINPLAISSTGELMALDGKVTVNNDALGRHPDLVELIAQIPNQAKEKEQIAIAPGLDLIPLEGNIGVLCNGAGLTMATLDLLHNAKGKPANFLNVCGDNRHDCPPDTLQERILEGLHRIGQMKGVKVILVNVLATLVSCDQVAGVIMNYLKRQGNSDAVPPLVVRLVGDNLDLAKDLLAPFNILVTDDLDAAIAETVSQVRSK